jgi:hypothetical protein
MLAAFIVLLAIVGIARGEGTTTVYTTLTGQGAGYDPALGVRLDHTTARWRDIVALHGSARGDLRKKYSAEDGHTYSVLALARAYLPPAPMVYLGAGVAACGYRSEFAAGHAWSKDTVHAVLAIGYDTDVVDMDLAYYAQEHSTPNEVEALKLCLAAKFYGPWKAMIEFTGMEYRQGTEDYKDMLWSVGLGYEW